MDEKPLPIACCACCYFCDCNSLQLHRGSPCIGAYMLRLARLMERKHELGGMEWVDDECDAYSKDACARAWGHVRK